MIYNACVERREELFRVYLGVKGIQTSNPVQGSCTADRFGRIDRGLFTYHRGKASNTLEIYSPKSRLRAAGLSEF